MKPRRGSAPKILALVVYIIVILVATPQAQQPGPQAASFSGSPAIAAGPAAMAPDATDIDLLVGRSTILNVGSPITRVSLTVPDVADAMVTSPQQLLIHGKTPGTISMFVWDRTGAIKTYEVNVRRDLKQLVEQVQQLFPGEPISVVGSGKDVILSGTVSSKYVIDKASDVAGGYVEKKENVVNLLKQQEGVASNQVMLRVRFAEVSRNALQELGVNLFTGATGYKNWIARSTTQQFSAPDFTDMTRTSDLDDNLTGASGKFTLSDFLNIFVFNNKYNMGGVIRALEQKGLFQSLAEPNLIAINGKEASFLAGGEYPYPVAQAGGGNTSITIQFKEFGIRLSFTPTVLGNDLINLKVKPEVSSLDFANGVSISGFRVPALSTRRTETEVELADGQTFAIAGLMNNTVSQTMSKIPGIGDIPILGYLFKSRAYQKQQSELVVMITPQIVRKGGTGVSQGLPSISVPYLGAPDKAMPQPPPYVGSPRYTPGEKPKTSSELNQTPSATPVQPQTQSQPVVVASQPAPQPASSPAMPVAVNPAPQAPAVQTPAEAPMEKVQPMDANSIEAEKRHLEEAQKRQAEQDRKNAEAKKASDKKAAAEKAATDKKAAAQQAIADKKAADQKAAADKKAAEEKAIADKKAADEKAIADRKTAEAKAQQQKLDDERARREAEVAKKNADADRKAQDEQKKREKTLADAAERLRQAQAAYQAEIDKAKGGSNDKSKSGVQ
jgi:pilus assembly protein CpaC